MAITNGYATLAELKTRLGITDTDDDSVLEAVIEATSRLIDGYCKRRFYTTAADETRYFTATSSGEVFVDDLLSVTSIATDASGDRTYGTTWATTDYDLDPINAALDGRAYTHVRTRYSGANTFPSYAQAVKIVGKFGYSSTTPDVVNEACLIQAARLFKRRDAPFGVAGVGDLGEIRLVSALDPDVRLLLGSLINYAGAIA